MASGIPYDDSNGVSVASSRNDSLDSYTAEPHNVKLEQDILEPIAVVGFSLKFPQEATSPESFWEMLAEKRCAMTEWPKDRINLDAFYRPDSNSIDTIPVRGAHFLEEDLAGFDASFFSITSAEAVSMDPQQRGLLETAYRALENAGIPMDQVAGSKTGVYTGSFADDYKMMMIRDLEALPKYAATGGAMTLLANRLSWFFNLGGPSVNLDTACSSSMIALDIACQGLRNGECIMALVAGSNTIFGLDPFLSLTNMNFLSPEGRCFSFDDRGNGYARGEGFGVVVIKLLADAVRDGDTIRAVIRSTGSNQDGRTPGITQPSRDAQKTLIRRTYGKAGLDPGTTRYFEAHGTGTAVGDPTEASAIGGVFREHRSPEDPLYIGAVKSNIGHLEGASGIAGLIKTIMVLEKGIIPPNTNFEHLNPKIDADFLNLKFPLSCTPWPDTGLRRASVNSFGFGGANSHAVLDDAYNFLRQRGIAANHCTVRTPPLVEEQAYSPTLMYGSALTTGTSNGTNGEAYANGSHTKEASNGINGEVYSNGAHTNGRHTHEIDDKVQTNGLNTNKSLERMNGEVNAHGVHTNGHIVTQDRLRSCPRVLVWSAADEIGVSRLLEAYAKHFGALSLGSIETEEYLKNLAYTLAARRSSLPWKSFAVVRSFCELRDMGIRSSKPVRSSKKLGLGFIFTGQGAQYSGMGRELLRYPVFQNTLRRSEMCLQDLGCEWLLMDELLKEKEFSKINNPAYSQPICTALQIALIELLRSFNIVPSAVIGHSSGEIAAAYCLGGLSLLSACKVAYFRGKSTATLADLPIGRGAMMAVGLSEAAARPYLDRLAINHGSTRVTVACINSPKNITLSGADVQIDALKLLLDSDNIFARKLQVDVAYHGAQMIDIADRYRTSIEELEIGEPRQDIPVMISSVTTRQISKTETCTSDYWVKNMVSPVKFSDAIARLVSDSAKTQKRRLGEAHQKFVVVHDLIEIGPHSALRGPVKETLETIPRGNDVAYSSLLIRHASALETTLNAAGRFYSLGYPLNLAEINRVNDKTGKKPAVLSNLPEYQFDHSQKYWYESRLSKDYRLRKFPRLDLLGTPATDWNPLEARWRKFIKVSETPWVVDHKVNGSIVYPAAGMLVMAIEGARQLADENRRITGYHIEEATFHKTLTIPVSQECVETQLYIRHSKDVSNKDFAPSNFRVCIYEDGQWAENCRGTIQVEYEEAETEVDRGKEAAERSRYYKQRYDNAVGTCNKIVEPERMYKHLQEIGLTFGPAFRPLQQILCNNEGEAIAEVRTFEWSAQDNSNHLQPHVVHPTTLDGVAQLLSVALTKGAQVMIHTTIPTRMSKLWISNSGLSHSESDSIQAYTKSAFKGYRGTESNIFALDKATGDVLLSIESLETTTVARQGTVLKGQSDQRQLCYSIDWKPDVDLMSSQQTLSYSKAGLAEVAEPVEFYQQLSLLLFSFVRKNYIEVRGGHSTHLEPHIRKYIAWMEWQIAKFDAEDLPHSQPDWKALSEDTQYIATLSSRIESRSKQGKFFVVVGQNLLKIINGEVDPLELLFQGELAEDYYREVFDIVSCCKHLGKYLDALAHKEPGMKILEVGAGTGGFTAQILSSLSPERSGPTRYARYDFTDISTSFFEKGKMTFGCRHERMEFKSLNIEGDPLEQGFELGTYDLLVASSVLHATRDLSVTMQNMRKLLKPGGKLVMFEITRPDIIRAGFVFGLLPGWWLSAEPYREWSPCITETQWREVLSQTGFSGLDLVFQDYQDQSCHEMSIIVSTAVEDRLEVQTKSKVKLVVEVGSSAQNALAHEVKNCLGLTKNSNCDIVSIQEAASAENKYENFYILLLETQKPFIRDMDIQSYKDLQKILSSAQELLWVTAGGGKPSKTAPDYGMVTGLARVLRSENCKVKFITMALESQVNATKSHAEKIVAIFKTTTSNSLDDCEPEYVERDGLMHINRLVEANHTNIDLHAKTSLRKHKTLGFAQGPPLKLTIATPGLLDSLQFVEDTDCMKPLGVHEVEFEVRSVGVNFMDCLIVLGRVKKTTLGGESAGIVTRVGGPDCGLQPGDRVCGGMLGCFNTYARCDAQLVTKIPDEVSFVEAAALPVTYVTAWHSLVEIARLQRGESILIHSASGGTGQSAIQIAQYLGAKVYVTIGSEEKKELIMDLYDIPADYIFYSRNATFAQGVMRMTNGRGVDVALNSLSGELLVATWECMAPYGRFVEIGKKDIDSHAKLPMFPFKKNVSFGAIDVAAMSVERPALFRKSLLAVMDLVKEKKLCAAKPLHVYPVSEVEQAFRYMQGGKNTGKTVVEMGKLDLVPTVLDTKPTYHFDSNATYLIAGGLGGLGRSSARWMVSRGARNLILLSRSGPRVEAAFALLEEMRSQGVQIEAPACDITSKQALSAVLESCATTMPPIKGCIQGTMVLKDGVFEKMSHADWTSATASKTLGSHNLSALLPPSLDFFILLSSIAGILGSGGQANYAAGNTYMDALAHHRLALGQKAVSLDLGWMKAEGVVAENEYLEEGFAAAGFLMPIWQKEFRALLERYCDPSLDIAELRETGQVVVGLETPAALHAKGMDLPYFLHRPTYRPLHQMGFDAIPHSSTTHEKSINYPTLFSAAPSLASASTVVSEGLVKKISKALSIPSDDIDTSKPLHAYAVDSLLAVELRNWFAKEFSADVAIFDIMGGVTFGAVGVTVAGKSGLKKAWD